MTLGQNTPAADQLRSVVERLEAIAAEKKELSDDAAAIFAEAKSNGFSPAAIRFVIKIRAMKPHDRQENEAMRDVYLHALGLDSEPPLFRFAGLAAIDTSVREQVIERMKDFVPPHNGGDITVNMGGKPMRLTRAKSGEVTVAEVAKELKPLAKAPPPRQTRERPEVPDVDAAGAFELGKQYAQDNRPVIDNPFPFGDPRRGQFDAGWREGSGNDGMGEE